MDAPDGTISLIAALLRRRRRASLDVFTVSDRGLAALAAIVGILSAGCLALIAAARTSASAPSEGRSAVRVSRTFGVLDRGGHHLVLVLGVDRSCAGTSPFHPSLIT